MHQSEPVFWDEIAPGSFAAILNTYAEVNANGR